MCSTEKSLRPSGSPAGGQRAALGRLGEDLAAAHFQRLGFRVLARNVRTRSGEIDLIVCDRRTLVFAEVKTRRTRARAIPAEQRPAAWLRPRQRARLRRLATAWLSESSHVRPSPHVLRFDAVGVSVDDRGRLLRLEHIEAAW